MAISVSKQYSPGWWLDKAFNKRAARTGRLDMLDGWHRGDPPVPAAVKEAREAFKEFEQESVTNWAELIVGSMRERLAVRDVRTGASGEDADEVAWGLWLDNDLDVEFSTLVETMLWAGDAYAMIGEDGMDGASVTPEDPRDVVTFHDPVRQSRYRAAAKFLHDADQGRDFVYLTVAGTYFEDGKARVFVATKEGDGTASTALDPKEWSWDKEQGGPEGQALKHEFVPVVRLRNRNGMGEFEPYIPQLRRINRFTFQLQVIVLYQAYKQRAILADVDDPDTAARSDLAGAFNVDDLEDVLTSDPGSWFLLPSGTKVWESSTTDTQALSKAIRDEQLSLAAVARRPMGMFAPDNQSAAGAGFTREGLTFAVEDKQTRLRRFLVDVFHLIFLTIGDEERADKKQITVSFMPADRYTVTDKAQATSQVSDKLPLRTVLREIWQMTPDEIRRVESEASDEALLLGEFTAEGDSMRTSSNLDDELKRAQIDRIRSGQVGDLRRAGVKGESAARQAGMPDLEFAPGEPITIRERESGGGFDGRET